MENPKHIIVGTAGHIDHGKSSLILALTGTDPDRLAEEKRRGIQIVLGLRFWIWGKGGVGLWVCRDTNDSCGICWRALVESTWCCWWWRPTNRLSRKRESISKFASCWGF